MFNDDFFVGKADAAWRWLRWQERYDEKINDALTFITKAEYLEWVAAWKACYRMMTEDARQGKKNRDDGGNPITKYHSAQRRAMMQIRHAGKIRSWAEKQKQKQLVG